MQKIKILKPSLRIKKRYISFEVLSEKSISLDSIIKSFSKAVRKYIGDYGYSMSSFQVVKKLSNDNKITVKTNSKYDKMIRFIASTINKIDNIPTNVHSIRTSGILKKI